MRISDWSSDVCSSDLKNEIGDYPSRKQPGFARLFPSKYQQDNEMQGEVYERGQIFGAGHVRGFGGVGGAGVGTGWRSEEHTSELQSLMRISYAVFCLKKKTKKHQQTQQNKLRTTTP